MKTFTHDFIIKHRGCYSRDQLMNFDFFKEKQITVQCILESSIPVRDKYWFFTKKVFTKEQNQRVAIGVAWIVLEIFEAKYQNDDRPRKAIQAAEDYLDGRIDIEALKSAHSAAYSAAYSASAAASASAAYSAAAAAASAYSAAAASASASAAYYAAYSAYSAAAASAAAASAAAASVSFKDSLLSYLCIFCEEEGIV